MDKTKLTINTGLKLVVWGIPLGLTLRLIELNLFFDFDTGFCTPAGTVLQWLSLLLPVLMALAGAVCFYKNPGAFTPRASGAARGSGIMAGFSGGVQLVVGLFMLKDYMSYTQGGAWEFDSTPMGWMHLFAAVMCLIMGVLQSCLALWLVSGRDQIKKLPLFYAPAVLWGVSQLVVVYVSHARFSSTVENLFSILSSALITLALLQAAQVLAGFKEAESLKKLFSAGGLAAVIAIPYDLSNIALAVMGKTYFGELPAVYALGRLSVSAFLLALVLSCYRLGVDKAADGAGVRHMG